MDLLEAIILGIVQGATEFLPVSSSGHLVLASWWLGLDAPHLLFTVTVHLGTTASILLFFWREWWSLFQAGLNALRMRSFNFSENPELWLLFLLIIGTVPAAIFGVFLADFFENLFKEPALVSINLLITAAILIYGEWATRHITTKTVLDIDASENIDKSDLPTRRISKVDALAIGFAQAFSILPGISRSGSTIAAGMARGLDRNTSTRYSFLLATPIIIGAGLREALNVFTMSISLGDGLGLALAVGFVVSALVGYICIVFLLRLVRRYGFYGFAGYCVVFGLLSLGRVLVRG